jgi:hypothetical protein
VVNDEFISFAPNYPLSSALILTHMLQTEMKSKMSARKQAFAKRASLSRWCASQEGHHGSVPDSHPGVPLPSRRCPPSWSEAIDRCARPTRPASEAQSPGERGALGLHARRHAPATSARQEATTDPSLRIRPSTGGPCRSSMRHPLLRHW